MPVGPTAWSPGSSRLPSLSPGCSGNAGSIPATWRFSEWSAGSSRRRSSVCLLVTVVGLWLAADCRRWARVLLIPAWLLCTLGVAWLSYAWPAMHYRHTSYMLDAEGIEIRSGVWWRRIISVPRSRVQHIDVSQGPMERSYGLGRLVLYTAGTAHSRVELPGLSYAVAFALRNHLLPRGSDDAV